MDHGYGIVALWIAGWLFSSRLGMCIVMWLILVVGSGAVIAEGSAALGFNPGPDPEATYIAALIIGTLILPVAIAPFFEGKQTTRTRKSQRCASIPRDSRGRWTAAEKRASAPHRPKSFPALPRDKVPKMVIYPCTEICYEEASPRLTLTQKDSEPERSNALLRAARGEYTWG
jgi:hypothetical protein